MSSFALNRVTIENKRLRDYSALAPEVVRKVSLFARPLQNLRVVHLNATQLGGGVAEMLRSLVPLERDIGLKSSWLVLPPDDNFFEVTKKIHNLMQGKRGSLTDVQKKLYLNYNKKLAGLLSEVKCDVLIIHDPQPAASLSFLNGARPRFCIWRCHIDTSSPNKSVWDFLLPYLRIYDRCIFTLPEYTNQDFGPAKLSFITPFIDPLNEKNLALSQSQAKDYLQKLGINTNYPLLTQISRFDPWKDPFGVIDAYRIAKKKLPNLQLALVAQMATDDPEGAIVLKRVKSYAKGEKGIYLFVNLKDNDLAVNAFQVGSDIIIQKSIKEGFGLTVTEAMWKGACVIGGKVGGIKVQIKNGYNGYLVSSAQETSDRIIKLIKNPTLRKRIAKAAHRSVKEGYLLPQILLKELMLYAREFTSDAYQKLPERPFLGLEA